MQLPDWSNTYAGNGKKVVTARHEVFGWGATRQNFPVGSQLVVIARETIPRAKAPNRGFYTTGLANLVVDGVQYSTRQEGDYTHDFPDHPAGRMTVTAVTPVELWCFDYGANGNRLPDLEPVRISAGSTYTIDAGRHFFLMRGTLGDMEGPETYVGVQRTLVATTPCYGFVLDGPRPPDTAPD